MKNLIRLAVFGILFIPIGLFSQNTLSGTVTDATNGDPILGVNVLVKGTSNGTSTDFDGNYTLSNLNMGEQITFSYLGYVTQEITFNGQSQLNISLQEDAAVLDEVVLIGYGTANKQDATGAVQRVTTEEFNQGAIVSPDQLLSGKSAGVRITSGGGAPGEGAEILIRGGSSLAASNAPLIVVDGVPLDQRGIRGVRNSLNSINPSEIESFDVLKDASATAIYGSRASNGVILITTKKGRKNTPLKLEYGYQFSVDKIIETVDVLNGEQLRNLVNNTNGEDPSLLGTANTEWQDLIYRTATGGIHNLVASQGFENFTYRINYNNASKQGILRKDFYQRNALNINLTADLLDNHLKLNLSTKGSIDDNYFANRGAIGSAIVFDPTQPVYQENRFGGFFEFLDGNGDPVNLAPRNPLGLLEFDNNKATSTRSLTSFGASYKLPFFPDLKVNVNAGYDYAELDGLQTLDGNSVTIQNGTTISNTYTALNRNTQLDFLLNYKTKIESLNGDIDVLAGHSYQEFFQQQRTNQTRVGVSNFNDITIDRNALESYFGRVQLNFGGKYLISGSFRRDGSSRFGPESRWGNFPAASVGWNISNEDFLKDSNLISNLKLRGGFGVTGNNEINVNYGYLGLYTPGLNTAAVQFGNQFINTLRPEEFDSNLKWEETTQYNAGIDLGLFKNRVNISLDGYYRETEDLLARIPLAAGTNLSDFVTTNVGETLSRGLELTLNTTLFDNEDFYWNINANGSLQDLEITKLNLSGDENFFIPQGGISGGLETPSNC